MTQESISFACPDWWQKLQAGRTPIPDLPLDEVEASIAVDLLNKLRIPDIPGQPTFGEAGGEWVRDIVRAAFGCVREVPDPERPGQTVMHRLVGEVFNLVPKKNGKTTNAAALGIIAMMMNRRPNVDGLIIGPTQEVAEKCFAQASAMIEADEYLSRRFKVIEHRATIVDLHVDQATGVRMNTRLKIKSFDPKVVTGSIPAFAILDELHVMAESHHADRVIRQIRGGMITNPESLLVIITTQSERPPKGVFREELDYARRVRDGEVTRGVRMLPVLYELPADIQASDDKRWRDPRVWASVTPNLGRSITLPRLVELYEQEREKGPESEAGWASQHLNLEIGIGLHANLWPGARHWLAAAEPGGLTLAAIMERCEVCTVGIDGGGEDDLFALCVLGRERGTRDLLAWVHCWCSPVVFDRRKSIAAELHDAERAGDLTVCEYDDQDLIEAAAICASLHEAGLLPSRGAIGLDEHGGANVMIDALVAAGVPIEMLHYVGQDYRLQPANVRVARMLKSRRLRHGNQTIMRWCVGNAKQELKGSNHVITKAAAGTAKIDPVIALLDADMLMMRNPQAPAGGLSGYLDALRGQAA